MWTQLFAGGGVTVNRVGADPVKRGDTCIGVFGGIQPEILSNFAKGKIQNGFFPFHLMGPPGLSNYLREPRPSTRNGSTTLATKRTTAAAASPDWPPRWIVIAADSQCQEEVILSGVEDWSFCCGWPGAAFRNRKRHSFLHPDLVLQGEEVRLPLYHCRCSS